MHGRDMDLGAHLTVLTNRGLRVCGPDIAEVFGPVPTQAYIESVMADMDWSEGDCMYHVLNRCRTLAYLADGKIRSKAECAEWMLKNTASDRHAVISEALACYTGGAAMSDISGAEEFCRAADARIHANFAKILNKE
jgi:streptomycin 3"-adenylyltransferase